MKVDVQHYQIHKLMLISASLLLWPQFAVAELMVGESLEWFFEQLTGDQELVTPPTITQRDRRRRQKEAEEYLRKELGC